MPQNGTFSPAKSHTKSRDSASTRKKVVVLMLDHTSVKGYLSPNALGRSESVELLTLNGEQQSIPLNEIKSVYFVRELEDPFEPERKNFLSRPKLGGLWVSLLFQDNDVIEGIVSNDLLEMLDTGVQLTPPDLNGNAVRIFIPRSALSELKVLGVVGATRRSSSGGRAVVERQSKLFGD